MEHAEGVLACINTLVGETLINRARGASKSTDAIVLALYIAYLGYRVVVYGPNDKNKKELTKYLKVFKEVQPSPFLSECLTASKSEMRKTTTAVFKKRGYVEIRSLGTAGDIRGPRADVIIYDEEREADKENYKASQHTMSGTAMLLQIHLSTPFEASVFHRNYLRLKAREREIGQQLVFERRWDEIPRFLRKRYKYEEIRTRLENEGRLWEFKVEYECKFEMPSGRIFTNVLYDPYSPEMAAYVAMNQKTSGLDWNPVAGHWLVAGCWTEDLTGYIVTEAISLGTGYTHQLRGDFYNRVKPFALNGNKLEVEDNGINITFCMKLREVDDLDGGAVGREMTFKPWDSQGVNKYEAAMFLRARTLFIDELRFPILAEEVRTCAWDEERDRPIVKKTSSSSPHSLDALLHAVSPDLISTSEGMYFME